MIRFSKYVYMLMFLVGVIVISYNQTLSIFYLLRILFAFYKNWAFHLIYQKKKKNKILILSFIGK